MTLLADKVGISSPLADVRGQVQPTYERFRIAPVTSPRAEFIVSPHATGATIQGYSRPAALPRRATLPVSLLRKQQEAIRLAKEYRQKHGNPVDELARILDEIVQDEEAWRENLDEPYG